MRAEQKCRTVHNITALSFSTATIASLLSVTTITVNALMLFIIIKVQKNRPKSSGVVSIALVNTVIADLLTGCLTDIVVTASHIIEGLQVTVRREVIVSGHVVHFLTTGAALLSVTFLSLDRIAAFVWPLKYRKSKLRTKLRIWHMFIVVWSISALFVAIYFKVGFIKYLGFYAGVNISIPTILMVATLVIYNKKFGGKKESDKPIPSSANFSKLDTAARKGSGVSNVEGSISNRSNKVSEGHPVLKDKRNENGHKSIHSVKFTSDGEELSSFSGEHDYKATADRLAVPGEAHYAKPRSESLEDGFDSTYSAGGSVVTVRGRRRRTDKRLLRALIINFAVFIFTYLPTAIFITYLNLCENCNCVAVHVLRDAIGLFVRLASLLRPVTFIVCTTSLREAMKKLLTCEGK